MNNKVSFSELRFPEHLSLGASGGPIFSTTVNSMANGYEKRNVTSLSARNRYNIAPAIRTAEDFQFLNTFFRVHKGRAIGFRYKDWTDYQLQNELIAVGEGSKRSYKITKEYSIGDMKDSRNITKIVAGTFSASIDNIITQAFALDCNTGVITLDEPLGYESKLTVTCEFDVPVRFDIDELEMTPELTNRTMDIPLMEVLQ